jgi:hypothetical protein
MNIPKNRKNLKSNAKPTKKTLDVQHVNKVNSFQDLETKQGNLKVKLQNLNIRLEDLMQLKKTVGLNNDEFNEYIKLIDEQNEIEREIDKLSEQIDEVDYYVNTGSILFQYYDILEKGNQDEEQINKLDVGEKSILNFFIKRDDNHEEEEKKEVKDDRASLLDKYLAATDETYMRSLETDLKDFCRFCGSSNVSLLLNDGQVCCNECHSLESITIDHDRPSYRDPPREITYFAYKRINHLNEFTIKIVFLSVFTLYFETI